MEHLNFEKARQEVTVMNALISAGVVNEDLALSNDRVLELGFNKITE